MHYRKLRLRFCAQGFRDNTALARNTLAACAPHRTPSYFMYIYLCTFLHWFPRRLPPFAYSSPMYPVGEHTAEHYPAFPPQSDSTASFLQARLRWSILPLSRQDASSHRCWRWFYPEDVGVSAIKKKYIYKVFSPQDSFTIVISYIGFSLCALSFPSPSQELPLLSPITRLYIHVMFHTYEDWIF